MKSCAGWIGGAAAVLLLMSGCAGMKKTHISSAGTEVTLSSDPPAAECKTRGLVSYTFFKGTLFRCDFLDAQNAMKNQAASRGANYVKLISITDAGVNCQGSGEAYACPTEAK